MTERESVWAVVVLYHPERNLVGEQFAATQPQVDGIAYYDNGGGKETLAQLGLLSRPDVRCLGDGENRGLAEGLNSALAVVQAERARFVLLLDQDSLPAADMIAALQLARRQASAMGPPVAAVGPAIFDAHEGRVERFGQAIVFAERRVRDDPRPFEVHYLITSGTMIDANALAEVGPMESSLFIDSVDFEWSYRARSMGYRLMATYGTRLRHSRGERLHRPLPGVSVRVHSAQRLFYIYRNHVRLCFRRYLPLVWKVRGLKNLALRMAAFALFIPDRRRHLGAILRGIREGLRQGRADRQSARRR